MECGLREDPTETEPPLLLLLLMLLVGEVMSPNDSITDEDGEDVEGGAMYPVEAGRRDPRDSALSSSYKEDVVDVSNEGAD